MNKTVLLIDPSGDTYRQIFSQIDTVNRYILVVDNQKIKENILSQNPALEVWSGDEILRWNSTHVSQQDIIECRDVQLKVEKFFTRIIKTPDAEISSIYYTSLAFWIYIFQKDISCVFLFPTIEHGSQFDSIPIFLEKKNNIPAIILEILFGVASYRLYSFKDCNNNKFIDISEFLSQQEQVNIDTLFDQTYASERETPLPQIKNRNLSRIYYTGLTAYSNICKFACKVNNKEYKSHKYISKYINTIDKLYFPIHYFLHSVFDKSNLRFYSMGYPCRLSVCEYLQFRAQNIKLKSFYNAHSIKTIPKNENVIVYFLHLEPEASIMNRTIYNSQIYNLKMLSKVLPQGWKIYVKEHPATFNINLVEGATMMKTRQRYRSTEYYKKLLELQNIHLLDWHYPSSKIINAKHVKAIATINGSVSLECLRNKKPIILFDADSCCYTEIPEVAEIRTYNDLEEIISKLESTDYNPKYTDYAKILGKYFVLSEGIWGKLKIPKKLMKGLLEKYLNENYQ